MNPSERTCKATAARTGTVCRRHAAHDSDFCGLHGRPRSIALAEQRKVAKERKTATNKIRHHGPRLGLAVPEDADPVEYLSKQLRLAEGAIEYWRHAISELDPDEIATHPAVTRYGEACDRIARLCKLAIDVGFDERRVRLEEAHLAVVAEIIMNVLTHPDLGLNEAQQEKAWRLAILRAKEIDSQ